MAGPSIVVRVLGDLKSLGTSMDETGTKAQSTAQRAHSAFSGMLSTLNQSGVLGPFSGALAALDTTFGVLVDHAKGIGTTMMGVGGGVLALGATLSAFGSKEQASHQQLQASIEATGHSYDNYGAAIDSTIKKQENYGHTSAETQDALNKLTEATHDPAKALELIGTASNVAAAKHEDLTSAATAVGKVYNGNTKLLKEFGVTLDKNTKLTADGKTATQALADVTAGQASAATDTFMGKLDAVKTKLEDQVSMFGQKYGPTLQIAGTAIMALGTIWEIVGPMMAAGELAALWPIALVIVGLAALGVAVYELYKNWDVVWGGIKAIAQDVWNWISTYWPYLLPILLGPIGVAAALIITNFGTIKAVALDAVNFIVAVWNGLYGFFSGLIGGIASAFSGLWSGITGAASAVVGAIQGTWSTIVGIFKPPSFAGFWDGIKEAFRAALNGIIDLWNGIHFPGLSIGPIHTPDIAVPQIPHLAQGGLITASGFVYAHAGEAISPIPNGLGGGGPAVVVENLTLSDELDVETFMNRAAWIAQTRGL